MGVKWETNIWDQNGQQISDPSVFNVWVTHGQTTAIPCGLPMLRPCGPFIGNQQLGSVRARHIGPIGVNHLGWIWANLVNPMWAIHMGPKWVLNVKPLLGIRMGNTYRTHLCVMVGLHVGKP